MSANEPQYLRKRFDIDIFEQLRPIEIAQVQERWEALTIRQMRIARMVARGKEEPEIARELHLSTDTVAAQLNHILRELNVDSRTMLVRVMAALVD